ncbi:MAG: T9SS type B sorting domain-containing protein [Flavobacteriaceae bacterium]
MRRFRHALFLLVSLWCSLCYGQIATDCSNAIPICNNTPTNGGTQGFGIDDFNGAFSSGCLEQTLSGAIESNSAWYRFRTGASGQLGFNIGFDTSEDWDFALYQTIDCNNLGDPVRCNFFDNQDQEAFMGVGEDPTGSSTTVLYEDWLQVEPGQDYYLLINNFSNTNSGFSIQFTGNIFVTNPIDALDCSIINNLLGPPLAACDNQNVVLDATTAGALSYNWYRDTGSGFQLITGENNPTLTVLISAMYRVQVVTASENIISDVQVAFSVAPTSNPIADETICSGIGTFDLSQKDSEVLGPQDPDDVLVSYHNSNSDAVAGINQLPSQYPVFNGTETIYVRTTSSANPNCFDATESFQLQVVETPVAGFPTEVFICENNTGEVIGEASPNPLYSYSWDTGETSSSLTVSQAGVYTLTLTNNSQPGLDCSNTVPITVVVGETPTIAEVIIDDLQTDNTVEIIAGVEGEFEYQLDSGPAQDSNIFTNVAPGAHTVTVTDLNGCGSVSDNITVVGFPKFFTPNGDGSNDYWHIMGVNSLEDPIVHVFDRYGKLIKQLDANSLGWDGTFNGRDLPSSDYWFQLTYMDTQGQRVEAKYISNHFALRR